MSIIEVFIFVFTGLNIACVGYSVRNMAQTKRIQRVMTVMGEMTRLSEERWVEIRDTLLESDSAEDHPAGFWRSTALDLLLELNARQMIYPENSERKRPDNG